MPLLPPLRTTTTRLLTAAAVGVALIAGTTGCAMLAPQATTQQYSPGDGQNVWDDGPIDVRNALIVANEDGTEANFVAAIVNPTAEAATLNLTVDSTGEGLTVRVPAGETISLGVDGRDPLPLGDIGVLPGAVLSMYFQSGDAEGTMRAIPVLDGSLEYLSDLAP